jgi:hypothetical protein
MMRSCISRTGEVVPVPEIDLCGADHVPDGDASVLAAGDHHSVAEPKLKAEHQRSGCGGHRHNKGGLGGFQLGIMGWEGGALGLGLGQHSLGWLFNVK